jgi:hypothetical protein
MMTETKEPNGLKTRVKYGAISPEKAREEFERLVKESGYRSESFDNWLRRYTDRCS